MNMESPAPTIAGDRAAVQVNRHHQPALGYGPAQRAVLDRESVQAARRVMSTWPGYASTPLIARPALAQSAGVAELWEAVARLRPDVVFANEHEAALAGEIEAETLAIKRGARGCVIRTSGGEQAYEALPADVIDSTGAGDAFAAGFLLGGPELALEAAARCVATMGAMP